MTPEETEDGIVYVQPDPNENRGVDQTSVSPDITSLPTQQSMDPGANGFFN